MTGVLWVHDAIGEERLNAARAEAHRRRISAALDAPYTAQILDSELRAVIQLLELQVEVLLDSDNHNALRVAAAEVFQVARALPFDPQTLNGAIELLRLACLGVLADRGADVRRLLELIEWPPVPDQADWGQRVLQTVVELWLRLLRKRGWEDLTGVQEAVVQLRRDQAVGEATFLAEAERNQNVRPAWELITLYHLAKAAEILAIYLSQGAVEQHFDVREQLEAQFDRAIGASERGQLVELEMLARLLARTARVLVDNSIWTVTRAVNSRVTKFVASLTARDRRRPILEMLPLQRRVLREHGLLGAAYRAVVVSLPTSSGKTFIAQFRILQALNQFDHERGWVAYLAPTRALVNQLTRRLRRDFEPLGIIVEKVSPALEIDSIEASILTEVEQQFRILVTTPEKLDLILRGGWETRIGRPLTLVIVDEAHNIADPQRGLRLELLLATINRECRYAQFLLLTPFVPNADELARWLSPDSHQSIAFQLEWVPNDRVIALAQPARGQRGAFSLHLTTLHTSHNTLSVPETITLAAHRPLQLRWSDVARSPNTIAAAIAHHMQRQGTVIVLAQKPSDTWRIARLLARQAEVSAHSNDQDVDHICQFLTDEMGDDFPLISLIRQGLGVHHSGLSDDTRALMEWLTEQGKIRVLAATTTIAQGVNFPVSSVVFASHQYPYGQDMPPEDFWNIAGRVGRVDQRDLGVVLMAVTDDKRAEELRRFVNRSVGALNSALVAMVDAALQRGEMLQLEQLYDEQGWSAFLQYLAHTYRQINDHRRFLNEAEQVLRGALGFQKLRHTNPAAASGLLASVRRYAERMQGKPLSLVDATGFSLESVQRTLVRLKEANITSDAWSPDLFTSRPAVLKRMMGVLLDIPELRVHLQEVTSGQGGDRRDMLARIVADWVQGRSLPEMARDYFAQPDANAEDLVEAVTVCCRNIFGRLTQTVSWGLSALQAITLMAGGEQWPEDVQQTVRNLPARVYYGVNSDEALLLRLLNVPRIAADPLARALEIKVNDSVSAARQRLHSAGAEMWQRALGARGQSYYRVWSIIEGNA